MHPLPLNVRGGRTYPLWDTVIILSNVDPNDWWGGIHRESMEFKRRITSVVHKVNSAAAPQP